MKNLSNVLNIILLVAVIVLFILHFTDSDSSAEKSEVSEPVSTSQSAYTRVVYINTDSLLMNYSLAKELNEKFLKKYEDRRAELNSKAKELEKDYTSFQRKLKNNGFLTEARAIAARDEIIAKEQKLKNLQQSMSDEFTREQNDMNNRLFEVITSYLAKYNKTHNYDMILGVNGGTVLCSHKGFDITEEVLTSLNEEYNKSK